MDSVIHDLNAHTSLLMMICTYIHHYLVINYPFENSRYIEDAIFQMHYCLIVVGGLNFFFLIDRTTDTLHYTCLIFDVVFYPIYWCLFMMYVMDLHPMLTSITATGQTYRLKFFLILAIFSILHMRQKYYYYRVFYLINNPTAYLKNLLYRKNRTMIQDFFSSCTYGERIECPICMTESDDMYIETICKHKFCISCFVEFYHQRKCPMCRRHIVDIQMNQLVDTEKN